MFGVGASAVRRRYRQTTQAMRLVVLFLALLLPLAALYPLAWFYADSTAREIVSRDYSPATARRPNDTLDVLTRVRAEIDRIPLARLLPLVAPTSAQGAPVPTLPAFEVWSETSLASTRLTAAIELYGAEGSLVSRFALNMPEYQDPPRPISNRCRRRGVGAGLRGAVPFGAEERDILHARREVCDPSGQPRGAILVHVINDYQALPFVSTPIPIAT
jgi:hypothetical protein